MEKNSKQAVEPSSSFLEMLGNPRLRRRMFKIPKDQQKLLDSDDSWASKLKRSSKPLLNVPPEVLENIKAFHRRQLQATESNESIPSPNPQAHTPKKSVESSSQHFQTTQPESELRGDDNGDSDGDDDDNTDNVSKWSSSPSEHLVPPKKTTSEDVDDYGQPQFITQPPVSSPQPTMSPLPKLRAPFIFPPSSQAQEEPLEIEVPAAIDDAILPVNKSAVQLNNTPPSAQIVPCTFDQSAHAKPFQKQRIYNEPQEFYRPPKKDTALKQHLAVRNGIQTAAPYTDVQSSTTTSNLSSSIIPSTIQAEAPGKDAPIWPVNATTSPSKESPTNGDEGHDTQDSPLRRQQSPEYRPPSPILRSSPPIRRAPRISPPAISRPRQVSLSSAPFIRYTMTYPNYNGSISDFVTACMYIQQIQSIFRTSLYDDFIRAWHEGYIPYVRECDDSEPPVKALNAVNWYSEIDDDPLFTSRVVTRGNLKSTLEFYPEELRAARSLLGVSPKPTPEPAKGPSTTRMVENHRPAPPEKAPQTDKNPSGDTPEVPKPELSKAGSVTAPQPNLPTLPRPHQKTGILPLHKSMSEMETTKKPAPREFGRSYSEATHHKRKASEDMAGTLTKRISVNSLPKSDSGSVTSVNSEVHVSTRQSSVAPSSVGGRRRKKLDPERRNEKLRQHWQRKAQEKRDRIASSAPVSNTPTSAQRE
ncbi:hypothetical protein F4821DRAFT_230915 [Hypoxylon rubiginosum]|uniref:Uncharacterized protein n=1 Tax=Hypoxylon rubiginosum TaxID=110542 RepID=A0ACC0DBL1_9PEZI|nr:hypothetical protein F4821DRAFT_230915 [Hypoxylon rubiginosum]